MTDCEEKRGHCQLFLSLISVLAFIAVSDSPVFGIVLDSAQLAVGSQDGLTAQVELTYMNESSVSQRVNALFFAPDGDFLSLDIADTRQGVVSLGVDIGPSSTQSYLLESTGGLSAGWIQFDIPKDPVGDAVVIQVTFQNLDAAGHVVSAVGVPVRKPGTHYVMAVQANSERDVGFAVANPDPSNSVLVSFALLNRFGTQISATIEYVLEPRQQRARFVITGPTALFSALGPQKNSRLVISSDAPIAVLGLRADFSGPFVISSIPVTEVSGP